MGFDAVELCVRPGYQVEPDKIAADLPKAVRDLADMGLKVESISTSNWLPSTVDIEACASAGVPMFRGLAMIGENEYLSTEADIRKQIDDLLPVLMQNGVKLGIQNHCGKLVCNAMGLRHLIEDYDPKYISAVWDPGHGALHGEEIELALDIVWDHLGMVNLKNAYWSRAVDPESGEVTWPMVWTTGWDGKASFPLIASELKRRDWSGVLCLGATYTDASRMDELVKQDLDYAKSLFEG